MAFDANTGVLAELLDGSGILNRDEPGLTLEQCEDCLTSTEECAQGSSTNNCRPAYVSLRKLLHYRSFLPSVP